MVYNNVMKEFDLLWCVKGPIATRSNLLVTWKIGLGYLLSLSAPWALLKFFHHGGLFSVTLAIKFFQFVPHKPPPLYIYIYKIKIKIKKKEEEEEEEEILLFERRFQRTRACFLYI